MPGKPPKTGRKPAGSRRRAVAAAAQPAAPQISDRRRVTSYDVAKRAGVSQSAVSRCFTEGASASSDLREKVMRAAEELGYRPNAIARGLITRRSNLVAVVISSRTNLYYPEVLFELTTRFEARGSRVLLFALEHESDVDHVLDKVFSYQVDGVVAAARLSDAQVVQFERHGIPVVLYNRFADRAPASSVCCDHLEYGHRLAERLVAAGHKSFGIIDSPADSFVGIERIKGVRGVLKAHGFDAPSVRGDYGYESGGTALAELLKKTRKRPAAVICANDAMALGAIDYARNELGLEIPKQLSIVGFDGIGPAYLAAYRLTTVRQPVRRMTEAAVSMLMERIEDPTLAPEKRMFSGDLVEGASARLGPA
ncbi:LacI family DNA-binding transcriptional regulator [Roseiterribacter gracilis]|uniref:LacI family transcriptional regulator n=1 Tax=Roseiterribacter gracilis TaxID=2812848 RepID=A0A8S8X7G1_9PROT|nr:LacI family transcriptional regulator [Rhodospirillales bacterium TMPK1]